MKFKTDLITLLCIAFISGCTYQSNSEFDESCLISNNNSLITSIEPSFYILENGEVLDNIEFFDKTSYSNRQRKFLLSISGYSEPNKINIDYSSLKFDYTFEPSDAETYSLDNPLKKELIDSGYLLSFSLRGTYRFCLSYNNIETEFNVICDDNNEVWKKYEVSFSDLFPSFNDIQADDVVQIREEIYANPVISCFNRVRYSKSNTDILNFINLKNEKFLKVENAPFDLSKGGALREYSCYYNGQVSSITFLDQYLVLNAQSENKIFYLKSNGHFNDLVDYDDELFSFYPFSDNHIKVLNKDGTEYKDFEYLNSIEFALCPSSEVFDFSDVSFRISIPFLNSYKEVDIFTDKIFMCGNVFYKIVSRIDFGCLF